MVWDMRGGAPSQGYGRPPPMMDNGYPAPEFPVGPTSPPPFYAPNGPGPLTSALGSGSMSTYPGYQPESNHREHHHSKHRHRSPQVIVKREGSPQTFPHLVNQGTPKPPLVNPGFMNPDLINSGRTQSTPGYQRRRTQSQGNNQGRRPSFSTNQGAPDLGFPNPNSSNLSTMASGNSRSTQENIRYGHGRTYSQDHSPGFDGNQGSLNPGFTDPRAVNSGRHHYSTQGSPNQERSRSHSHTRSHSHHRTHHHHHSHSHHRSHSHDRRPQTSSIGTLYMTTASHVSPLPIPSPTPSQQLQKIEPQPAMPPPEPRHIRLNSMPGSKHDQSQMFQYSRCTGRKKALCIGINYQGQQNELRGCVNDAKNVHKFLINHWGYKPGDIVLLTDDARDRRQIPTRKNMIDAMRWLVNGAKCHDALLFHYSGHGGQTRDLDGDEIDGYDEVIFPVDYARAGHIVDDDLHSTMVKPLPQGCRLTAVFDSCHSGTALDLPYVYHSNGRLKGVQVSPRARREKSTPADVISWCACKDDQTSADTTEAGLPVGAMSYAFILSLKQNPNQSYIQLLKSVREILRKRYSQKSQLSSSHPIDTKLRFIM